MAEETKKTIEEVKTETTETKSETTENKPKIDLVYRYVVSRLMVDGKVRYDIQALANDLTKKDEKPAITNQQAVLDVIELGKQLDREIIAENIYSNVKTEKTADTVKDLLASKDFADFLAKIVSDELTKVLAEKFGGASK